MNNSFEKVSKKLQKGIAEANIKFGMVEAGDLVMVCLSGGKDSYTMLDMLLHMQKVAPFDFEIIAVNLDQKQPGFPEHILPNYLIEKAIPFKIIEKDTYSIVVEKTPIGKTMCSMCSRLRRGNLYTLADELGATKIALGHHKDDILETFFLNLFFSGKMETMPPKYKTDDGRHIVIRPLAFCNEEDITVYATEKAYPIIPCTLCGSQEQLQRKKVKKMMNEWQEAFPDRKEIIFNALGNVSSTHLLDTGLFDFKGITPTTTEPSVEIN